MNYNILVSILVPIYNVDRYLPQCLDSITSQTYSNLQIILIDDGSSDNSWEIMQEYAQRDNRIEIYHQDNQGVASTRNNLLEKIKGEYFLFVDSDDWMEMDMVEFLLQRLIVNKSDIAVCANVLNDNIPCITFNENVWKQDEVVKEFLRHIKINGSLWNKLIKTSLIRENQFDSRISYGEDALFCWKIIQNLSSATITNKQLYHYRTNPQSISHQKWTPEKKGSGHVVWKEIVLETSIKWTQYLDVAQARFAIEDMWGLYFAAISSYPYDEHIKSRQINVRKNLGLIRRSGLINYKKILAAYILSYSYRLGGLLRYV